MSFCVTLATSQSRLAIIWGGLGGRTQNGSTSRCSCSSRTLRCSSLVCSLSMFSCSSACFCCNLLFSSWSSACFSRSSLAFSCNLLSLVLSSASFAWRSWVRFLTFLITFCNSSVGKPFCVLTVWISTVDRPRFRNAVSTLLTVMLKSVFESWPSVMWAKSSLRNFLRSSTLVLISGLSPWIESENRMA